MGVEKNIVTDTIFELFQKQDDGPKYRVLSAALRQGISEGRLPPETRLPPVRELAWRLEMTPGTVAALRGAEGRMRIPFQSRRIFGVELGVETQLRR